MKKLLVIDNYDSFTYNLVQMFMRYDLFMQVYRADKISISQIKDFAPDYIIISPGPKDPEHAGISISVIENFGEKTPILGVCLGMQCINEAFGGKTKRALLPMHGKTSIITHNNKTIFKGIPQNFTAARYHSLIADFPPHSLIPTAYSEDNVVMGLSHPKFPIHGVQFHPESFLTQHGHLIAENFLNHPTSV